MRVIENDSPAPRLLTTAAVPELRASIPEPPALKCKLQGSGWGGNAFAIFAGIGLGAVLLCAAGRFFLTRHAAAAEDGAPARLVAVAPSPMRAATPAESLAAAKVPPSATATPVVVQITPELFRVTAISLGHPRLAVVNRQQVAEGDWVEVNTPTAKVGVKLHVIRIADGGVELLVGDHVITVPIEQMKLKRL